MPLIRDGEIIEDTWTRLGDDDVLPEDGDAIVSHDRLRDETDAVLWRKGRTGVALTNSEDPAELEPLLGDLDLIALEFPAFTDGRAYSQARLLRSKLGYTGELRATGQVLADQAPLMLSCGFDTFEVDDSQNLETWRRAASAMTLTYQRAFAGDKTSLRGKVEPRDTASDCVPLRPAS